MNPINRIARSYNNTAVISSLFLSALLLLNWTSLVSAEEARQSTSVPVYDYNFKQLSIQEGLLDNEVQTILQDRAGYIWLGTSQGLTLYDGAIHTNFHHNIKKPDSLSSNIISALYSDAQARLWVGTENGLNRQLSHGDSFERFMHDPESQSSLADNHIVDIVEDSLNNLWVASESAVHLYNDKAGQFNRYSFYDSNTAKNAVINWIVAKDDSLYVGTSSGLFSYLVDEDSFYRFSESDGLPVGNNNFSAGGVDKEGALWISIEKLGVFSQSNGQAQFLPEEEINSYFQNHGSVVVSAISSPGGVNDIWIGTLNHGLYRYDSELKKLSSIKQSDSDPYKAFQNSEILNIFSDQSGLVWVSTRLAGIFQWSQHTLNIEHIAAIESSNSDDYRTSYIWYFHQTRPDEIWVGSQQGLALFNPKDSNYERVLIDPDRFETQPQIFWIESNEDTMWLATEVGVVVYNIKDQKVTSIVEPINDNNVYYAVASTNGYLFLAIDRMGLMAFDAETEEHKSLSITLGGPNSHLVKNPVGIKSDDDGSLWVLTRDRLVNYDPKNDRVRLSLSAGADELSGNRVSSIFQVDANTYWIGTVGNGINRLVIEDFEKGLYQIEQFDTNPQLANIVATGILVDDRNSSNVWISTHSGLKLFNPQTGFTRKFQLSEGMQSREYNEGAYLKGMDGQLYFGGVNGFNRIEPFGFTQSSFEPPLRITDFNINCDNNDDNCIEAEQRFQWSLRCAQYHSSCELIDSILPSNLESVNIKFASLDYTMPEFNQYRYRFVSDKKSPWTTLGTTSELTISGLDSGKYQIEIQGTNFTGEWSERSEILQFQVDKPWYFENYTLVILIMTLATSLYYFRESMHLKRLEQQRINKAIKKNEENFKFALWGSGDEIWDWDILNDQIQRTNPIQQIKVDDPDAPLTMLEIISLIHKEDASRVRQEVFEVFKAEKPYLESIFRFESKGGGYLWVLARARVVERNEKGQATRALGSVKDITLMKATEDKLNLIAQAFENTKDGISVVDADFKSVFNNKAFYEITGLSHMEALHHQYFFAEDSDNHDMYKQVQIALKNFGEWEGEIWERRPGGDEFAISLKVDVVHDAPNTEQYFICVFSDVTYRKRSEEELIKLANIDSLTGLPNRSLFLDRLSHAIAYSRRNKTMFALLFIDLDNFKNINDTLGHTIGDKMLINIAKRLKGCVRDVDTVARLGGDEFTVILENINTTNEVGICANKILSRLSESMEIEAVQLKSTPSIGIGMYPAHGKDQESILKNADLAMYSAKEKGKNNYQFFTEDMTSLAMERINIENKLRDAIDDNQLELYYQPKVFSVTGEIIGFEALIRWIHPEDGMISPGAFIPVAEETGLILSLGDWILEDAIRQAKEWSEINPDAAQIAVNISAKQFMSEYLPERIAELLSKYDLHPKFLELEITEGTLIENIHHTVQALNKLRDMGLMISLDDFGTGYSSLSYLKQFPVNKLKIDQSFVRDITTDPSDASIVASIITLAHNLGLNVVAEGCETIEQLNFIRSYHCEQVQGYLFSRPLPTPQAEELLRLGRIEIDEE